MHIRDLSGFIETRQKLLNLKSNNRSHWITLALAFHASNQCDMAAQVRHAVLEVGGSAAQPLRGAPAGRGSAGAGRRQFSDRRVVAASQEVRAPAGGAAQHATPAPARSVWRRWI